MTRRQASSSLFAYMQQMSLHHCLCPTKRDQSNTFIAHLGGSWVVAMRSSAQARLTNIIRQIFVLTYLLSTFSSSTYISVFRGKKKLHTRLFQKRTICLKLYFIKKIPIFCSPPTPLSLSIQWHDWCVWTSKEWRRAPFSQTLSISHR